MAKDPADGAERVRRTMRATPKWPDVPASKSGSKVRDHLDYLAWVAEAAERSGMHSGPDLESWRGRVQRAYLALVDPMTTGHGDPLPPDVPPSKVPGMWPDVPAAGIQGMTVRHQLTVIRTICEQSRRQGDGYQSPAECERWSRRIGEAWEAMQHGPDYPMPDSARTTPPAPPPAPPSARRSARKPSKSPKKAAGGARSRPAARKGSSRRR
jgi:hypothetical protein